MQGFRRSNVCCSSKGEEMHVVSGTPKSCNNSSFSHPLRALPTGHVCDTGGNGESNKGGRTWRSGVRFYAKMNGK